MTNDFTSRYLKILNSEFFGLNLTKVLDPDEFYVKQYIDSLYPFNDLSSTKELIKNYSLCVDVGFGGGFPLLVLASHFPEITFVGLEAKNKKVKAVKRIADIFGLKNVHVFHLRLEDIFINCECLLTAKAVGPIGAILKSTQIYDVNSHFVFYKGGLLFQKEDVPKSLSSWRQQTVNTYEIDKQIRNIVVYKNVPRRTMKEKDRSKNNKKLVKLSELIY